MGVFPFFIFLKKIPPMPKIIYSLILFLATGFSCFSQCEEYSIQFIEETNCLPNTFFLLGINDVTYNSFEWSRSSNIDDDQFLSDEDSLLIYVVGIIDTAAYDVYLEVLVSESLTCIDTVQIQAFEPITPIPSEVSEGLTTCNQVLNESLSIENPEDFQNLQWTFNNQTYENFNPNLNLNDLEFIQNNSITISGQDINGCPGSTTYSPSFNIEYGPQQSDFVTTITIDPLNDCYDINSSYEIIADVLASDYDFDTTFVVDTIMVSEYPYPQNIYYNIVVTLDECTSPVLPYLPWPHSGDNYVHHHPGVEPDSISIDFTTAGEQCSIFDLIPQNFNNEDDYNSHHYYLELRTSTGTNIGSSYDVNYYFQIEQEGTYDLYIEKESLCGGMTKDTLIQEFVTIIGDIEIESELDYLCVDSEGDFSLNIEDFSPIIDSTISSFNWSIYRGNYSLLGGQNNDNYSSIDSTFVEEIHSSEDSVIFRFDEPGNYLVEYQANISDNCTFSDQHTFNIGAKSQFIYPISAIENYPYSYFPELCSGLDQDIPFTFNSTSYLDIGSNSNYEWFTQSNDVTILSPNEQQTDIIFHNHGEFDISLAVENDYGCRDTISEQISVQNASASIQAIEHLTESLVGDTICGPVAIDLINMDTISGSGFYWTIFETPIAGDVSYLDTTTIVNNYTSPNPPNSLITHDFNTHANVDIQLVVESSYSCYDTILLENYFDVIIPLPNFTVEPNWTDPPCDSMEFDIIDQSNFVDEFSFVWLGDGVYSDTYDIGYTNTVTFEFPYVEEMSDESYLNYRFFIYDAIYKGCTNNFDTLVTILATPEVHVTIDELEVCENEIIDLYDASIYSSDADTSISQFYWDFGDGTTSTNQDVSHSYSEAGIYKVYHHITNGECSGDTIETTITVNDNPEANYSFSDSPICYNTEIVFENNSQSSLNSPSFEASWSFETPGESILYNTDTIVSFVPQTSPFEQENLIVYVDFTVTDQNGCSDSLSTAHEFIILDSLVNTPEINFVSVTDSGVYISIEETDDDYFNLFQVHHINSINTIDNFWAINSNEFIHNTITTNDQINEYFLIQEDQCNYESDSSDIHSTILLSTSSNDYQKIYLEWSNYSAWDTVASYEIFRSVDGEEFQYLGSVPGTQLSYLDSNMCNVPHGYYVRANHTNNAFISNSNISYIQPKYIDFMQPLYLTTTVVNNNSIETIINSGFIGYGFHYQIDRWDNFYGWSVEYDNSYELSYIDENVDVSSRNYIYRVSYHDICGNEGVLSNIGSNILLKGEILQNQYLLTWNPYREWDNDVEQYDVQLLNQTNNIFETIEVIEPLSTDDVMNFTDEPLLMSSIDSSYCYRIKAYRANSSDISYSNTKCFTAKLINYFASAFTPDGDNLNDEFQYSGANAKSLEVRIFSRWGKEVFYSDQIDFRWDGTDKNTGEICQKGMYLVRYKLVDYDNSVINSTTNLFLF